MSLDLTLQAGSTFWFEYPANPPARWIFEGQSFAIQAQDFPLYEAVAKEVVTGNLSPRPIPFAERIVTKVKEVLQAPPAAKPGVPSKFPCPHCGVVFKAQKGLDVHIHNAHKE